MPGIDDTQTPSSAADREIPADEKALVKNWNERLEGGLKRVEKIFKQFERNRKLLAGKPTGEGEDAKKVRANLHYANMAAMLPQVYAKDPEFAVQPSYGVDPQQAELIKAFSTTSEKVLTKLVVKDARLKRASKKMLRSAFATSIGWWKASWQEERKKDPLILQRLDDTQDNIERIKALLQQSNDQAMQSQHELKIAELHEAVKGLEIQQEVTVARGMVLDFVMAEDVIVLDDSVRSITDYLMASAMAHRVWFTEEAYQTRFGYKPKKAKSYTEKNGTIEKGADEKRTNLYCVWEIWDKSANRIYLVCEGEEGFSEPPKSPDWTGKRWYPFFGSAFNEIDGAFYPLSDVELTEKLVEEYNQNREDFVRDRKAALPLNVVREGGSLKDEDIKAIKNRQGGDIIVISGVGNNPLQNDIFSGSLAQIKAENYDTAPARQDMEQILGGGDTARGSVMKAKTATEAEILSQGLRGRSAERQDTMEDVLNELGPYALEMFLRKLTEQEVKSIAGPEAVWPKLSIDEVFNLVTVEVRGGSTGKPDRLQEQDRWTKLLPVIEKTMQTVSDLREKGQDQLADATVALARETLRRFDERLDIDQFLPPAPKGQDDPALLKQQLFQMKAQLEEMTKIAKDAQEQVEKGYVSAAASIATSKDPMAAAQAFSAALRIVDGDMAAFDQMPVVPPPEVVAAPAPAEPAPPAGPSPDVMAMVQAMGGQSQNHGAMADSIAQLAQAVGMPKSGEISPEITALIQALGSQAQGHGAMAQSIGSLAHAVGQPKVKIPVRDKAGNITHVVEQGAGS
jgi:hypothetical protein